MNFGTYKKLDIIFGWVAFTIAAVVYLLTIEPTTSFWDCGEFISSSYKLEVGHPPGAPLFMILARFFSLFASGPEQVALMVNAFSALASAMTISFLYWTIAYFARKFFAPGSEYTTGNVIAIIGASMIGAMAYTFSDTFWFSAVEGEVYATSSLFTAAVFWAILKWDDYADTKYAMRWVVLIALLLGLSIGVHLLNLLAIPAMVFVYYFRRHKPAFTGIVIALAISMFIIAAIMWGIIPGVAKVAAKFELFTVNGLGMGFNSGLMLWAILSIACLVGSIYFTQIRYNRWAAIIASTLALILIGVPFMSSSVFVVLLLIAGICYGVYHLSKKPAVLNLIMVSATMIMIGYSTFTMIIIRSIANPPMDQNNPENVFNLLYYLNREQYGDRPLFYGQYYYAEPSDTENGGAIYVQHGDRYEIADYKPIYVYDDADCTILPRMHSNKPDHIETYEAYGGLREGQKPSFSNNLKFMFSYQVGWMYMRYFMWNFAGRQNDIQGHGNIIHGNWKSGLSFIDTPRLGDQSKLPDYLKNNRANNSYFMLPLLLGLLGMIIHFTKNHKDAWIVTMLFILTGLAIVIYLNQTPYQPRERDYAYAGSFYAFSIWIGLGLMFLYEIMRKRIPAIISATVAVVACLPVPYIMASENWDDHNRSHRYIARDFAHNYLNSCAPNAILFTYGDNDTFPIWYAQEVEGVRTDVKVCCLPYFASDWYIDQMKMASYESPPMPLTMERHSYEPGSRDILYHYPGSADREEVGFISVDSLIKHISNDKLSVIKQRGQRFFIYPKNKVFLRIDSAQVVNSGLVKPQYAHLLEPVLKWDLNRSFLLKNELLTLDMLAANNWERPIYFTSIGSTNTLNLDEYFMLEGFTYKLVPYKTGTTAGLIDTEVLYDRYMNTMKWGNMNDPRVYIDHTIERTTKILRIRRNFARLAVALKAEDKTEKAAEVMAKCREIMPYDLFPMGYFDLEFAEAYYTLGDSAAGDDALRNIADISVQELDFFFSLTDKQFARVEIEAQMALATMSRTINTAGRHRREVVYTELLEKFNSYSEAYETK